MRLLSWRIFHGGKMIGTEETWSLERLGKFTRRRDARWTLTSVSYFRLMTLWRRHDDVGLEGNIHTDIYWYTAVNKFLYKIESYKFLKTPIDSNLLLPKLQTRVQTTHYCIILHNLWLDPVIGQRKPQSNNAKYFNPGEVTRPASSNNNGDETITNQFLS